MSLAMTVRFVRPCRTSSPIKRCGDPMPMKPPIINDDPSGIFSRRRRTTRFPCSCRRSRLGALTAHRSFVMRHTLTRAARQVVSDTSAFGSQFFLGPTCSSAAPAGLRGSGSIAARRASGPRLTVEHRPSTAPKQRVERRREQTGLIRAEVIPRGSTERRARVSSARYYRRDASGRLPSSQSGTQFRPFAYDLDRRGILAWPQAVALMHYRSEGFRRKGVIMEFFLQIVLILACLFYGARRAASPSACSAASASSCSHLRSSCRRASHRCDVMLTIVAAWRPRPRPGLAAASTSCCSSPRRFCGVIRSTCRSSRRSRPAS